ncbi:hypothetical protein J7E93_05390 [Streptomyces sp. ISL-36]|uniref:hypothetical protein n=1 Tax=Streptomyces sp. ISL-36 TaxID=2819182 RepID=UPI001BE9AF15|nr:hypothetical protein [Streptomyces sp. ISL-36]MBT2439566.1 hypothetical protein [Streptomyces sp. ISL-36]
MQHNDIPDRPPDDSGLTTEDIAGFGAQETGGGEGPATPMYPGEATATEAGATETEETPQESLEEPPGEDTAGGAQRTEGDQDAGQDTEEVPELLSADDVESFRTRWQQIQNQFVDDPREAVHAADGLVADVMRTLAETFADHKKGLEGQWNQGGEVDTESLRMALRQYRSFFNRLLTK